MSFALLNAENVQALHLVVGSTGPWYCDFELDVDAPDLTGAAQLTVFGLLPEENALVLSGTIDPTRTGVFGSVKHGRLIAGASGWSKYLQPKNYANDAGVKARSLAEDLTRETGETLGGFVPTEGRVGTHYVRPAGQAAQALTTTIGGAAWWVDYDGVTHVGTRSETTPAVNDYEILDFDPKSKRIEIACEDLTLIQVGSKLEKNPLTEPLIVRDLELKISAQDRKFIAWCGVSLPAPRLAHLLQSIVRHTNQELLFGVYLYRVFRMSSDRVDLQCASKTTGLPDLLPVKQWSGTPGTHAQLTPGAEVLVGFIEGDRTRPYIQSYVGKGGAGHDPVALELGGQSGSPAARQGDIVEVQLPPATFSGTIGGSPATGVLTFTPFKALGVITSGSTVVKVK